MESNLSFQEIETIAYYDQNAVLWAGQRKKLTEPSFWAAEYEIFQKLQKPQGKVLEIGSGSVREALELMQMGYEYHGVDASCELIKIAEQTAPSGTLHFATIYHLPFAEQTFDAFTSWAMLPHVPKAKMGAAFQSLKKTLKKGALGFLAMREGEGEKKEPETGRYFSYYSQEELENILKNNGFIIEQKSKKISRVNLVWLTFFVRAP